MVESAAASSSPTLARLAESEPSTWGTPAQVDPDTDRALNVVASHEAGPALDAWAAAAREDTSADATFELIVRWAEGASRAQLLEVAERLSSELIATPKLVEEVVRLIELGLVEGWGARLAVASVVAMAPHDAFGARRMGDALKAGVVALRTCAQTAASEVARRERTWARLVEARRTGPVGAGLAEGLLKSRRSHEEEVHADLRLQGLAAEHLRRALFGLAEAAIAVEDRAIPRAQRRAFGGLKTCLRGLVASLPVLASTPQGQRALTDELVRAHRGEPHLLDVAARLGPDQRRRVAAAVLAAAAAGGAEAILLGDPEHLWALAGGLKECGALFGFDDEQAEQAAHLLCAVGAGQSRAASELARLTGSTKARGWRATAAAWVTADHLARPAVGYGARPGAASGSKLLSSLSALLLTSRDGVRFLRGLSGGVQLAHQRLGAERFLLVAPRWAPPAGELLESLARAAGRGGWRPRSDDAVPMCTALIQLMGRVDLDAARVSPLLSRIAAVGDAEPARPGRALGCAEDELSGAGLRPSLVRMLLSEVGPEVHEHLDELATRLERSREELYEGLADLKDRQGRRLAVYLQQVQRSSEGSSRPRDGAWLADMVRSDRHLTRLVAKA